MKDQTQLEAGREKFKDVLNEGFEPNKKDGGYPIHQNRVGLEFGDASEERISASEVGKGVLGCQGTTKH